jgi:hypothetical protein
MKNNIYSEFIELLFDGTDDNYSKEYFESLSKKLAEVPEENLR